jgi:tetratricopeptide (TPR) repeat protein
MQKDELARQKQEKLDKLNELITSTKESARSIEKAIRDKLELLKVCYGKSSSRQRNKVHELINYTQLRCYLTGEPFSNSYETKPTIELKHIVYTARSINRHKESGLPDENNWQAIDIYSFYFGGYREFFRCFTKEFLELRIKQKKEFIEDVFSTKNIDSEETVLNQNIVPCQKLNIIPSIRTEESVLRIDILENLFNLFQNNKKVAITGISGIGKTFLAKHFTEYYEGKFSNMVWLNCANGFPKAFSQEKGIGLLGSLGLAKEYDSYLGNEKGLMNLVVGHLVKIEGNNLLILDNIGESIYRHKDEIALLSKNWNILGTSQQQLQGFENYIAPDFKKESLDLFYNFYTVEKDDDNLIRLLSAIEYHTLAIELLAKTAQEREFTIIALVNRFIKKGINVVEQVEIVADHRFEKKINIENIEQYLNIIFDTSSLKEEQCKILMNIALMQEDSIPIDLFQEVYLNNSSEEDIIDVFSYNIKTLTKKGWVQIEDDRIRLHSLIKSIIHKRFSDRYELFESTIQYLEKILREILTQHELYRIEYLILSECILDNITIKNKSVIHLAQTVSLTYVEMGLYEKAKKNETYHLNELSRDAEDINEIFATLHNLSSILVSQGKYEEALLYSEKIYNHFDDKTKKEMYFSMIDSLNLFFEHNKIYNISEFKSKFNLTADLQINDIILSSFSNLVMFKDENISNKIELLETISLLRQDVLTIIKENIPDSVFFSIDICKHLLLNIDGVFHHLARFYLKQKEYDKSKEFLKKALEIEEKILDNKHHYLSATYSSLTLLYIKCEDLESAKHYLEKNKEICHNLPPNSPYIATYKESLHAFVELQHKLSVSLNLQKTLSDFNFLNEKNQNIALSL